MKAWASYKDGTLFIEQRVIVDAMTGQEGTERIEVSNSEAIEVMAVWWEEMVHDGVNVASKIQKARQKIRNTQATMKLTYRQLQEDQ